MPNIINLPTKPPEILTLEQAASRLKVSVRTLYRMFESGELSKTKVRGRTGVAEAEVSLLINNQTKIMDNTPCTGSFVTEDKVTCNAKRKTGMASADAKTHLTGGHRTPMQTVKELDDLLGLNPKRKQRQS